jgi:hypothetical protein
LGFFWGGAHLVGETESKRVVFCWMDRGPEKLKVTLCLLKPRKMKILLQISTRMRLHLREVVFEPSRNQLEIFLIGVL